MRLPLPAGYSVTLWRSKAQGRAGAFISFNGTDGRAVYDQLLADRDLIDSEFTDAGLAAPQWSIDAKGGQIGLSWHAPLPWDEAAEEQQGEALRSAANQMVNSFRPRLERAGREP